MRRWARSQAERPGVVRVHARFERQLAYVGRRLQPHAASGLSLTSGLFGVVVVGWAFGVVVRDVISRHELAGVDGTVYRFFLDHRTETLTSVSRLIADLGGTLGLGVLTLAVGAAVWSRTRQARAILLPVLSVAGSFALVELVKMSVHRPAPPVAAVLGSSSGSAFPSGQATASAACLLTAAFLGWGVLRSWRSKVLALTAAVSLSMLVGLVGLALGAHWLTDVLGGWALGTLWFAIIAVVSDVAATLHHRGPADATPPPKRTTVPSS